MRIAQIPAAALAAALLLHGCSKPPEPASEPDTPDAQTNIQDLAARWVKAYNDHDRAALGAVYTGDARLMLHGSATISGRAAIEEFWAGDFTVEDPLTLLDVTNSVAGLDMMLVHGNYRVVGRENGDELGTGRFAHLWKLDGEEWRLDRDLWNQPHEPYSETAAATDVQALADKWVKAYNAHDRDALAALYGTNAELMMHGGPTIKGQGPIGEFWALDFEEGNPLTLLTVTHAVDGSDMILVHGNYEVVGRDGGDQLGSGRFAHIWLKDAAGEWKLDRDLWVMRSPPDSPAQGANE
jgi:ketosteroid isomerase-like protein